MQIKTVDNGICAKLMLMIGVLISVPVIVLPFYPDEWQFLGCFIAPGAISVLLGTLLGAFSKQKEVYWNWKLRMQSGSFIVLFAWGYGFFLGAVPFVLSGQLPFVGALFESISGWTTTGLSVMDVSITPKIFLFHRSFMQFCGGLGFIMMMVTMVHEKQSMNLYSAEGHPDNLLPSLKKTARIILAMYIFFLIMGTALYVMFGMNLFDSITHAMCALSTGGFSTKLGSIGEYQSLPIELITIFLMIIGATNFAVLLLVAKRKFREFIRVSEIRFMAGLIILSTFFISLSLIFQGNMSLKDGVSKALFDGVSALSTTGYSSMSYIDWPEFAIGILIILMLIGGGIGSTAGGIKMSRVYIIYRVTIENIKKRLSPSRRVTAPKYYRAQGQTALSSTLACDTIGFLVSYITIFLVGSFLLTLTADCSLTHAMFEFASALGTVGLSIGITSPLTNDATLIIEMVGMVLGRLEIFIVLTGVYSSFCVIKQGILSTTKNKQPR